MELFPYRHLLLMLGTLYLFLKRVIQGQNQGQHRRKGRKQKKNTSPRELGTLYSIPQNIAEYQISCLVAEGKRKAALKDKT